MIPSIMENINHLAVFVCALASLLIGGLWCSPLLFAKVWQRETGLTDEQLKDKQSGEDIWFELFARVSCFI